MSLTDDNTLVCTACERRSEILALPLCDYCGIHAATTPSDGGTWICDYCITKSLVGESKFAQILAVQACLAQFYGIDVTLETALAEWRRLQSALQNPPATPPTETTTHTT